MDAVEEQQEEPWFDVFVRRPGSNNLPYQQVCTEPTEVFTTTYSQQHENGDDIELTLRGYKKDSEQTMISSGLSDWESSEYLCKYLMSDEFMKRISNRGGHRLLELGSGLGKCGLLAHNLLNCQSTTVLTDGDTNALHLLRQNVAQNTHENNSTRSQIYCEQLLWGRDAAKVFLSEEDPSRRYDTIIGSDLLYTNRNNIRPLFETVDELMDDYGCFVLAHNENHLIQVEDIIEAARSVGNLFCEVLKEGKKDDIYVLCFRRPLIPQVHDVMNKLQDRIAMLEIENERLKSNTLHMEEKNRRLDERCTVLRGKSEDDLQRSILLSLEDDNIVVISSYLEPKDLSSVSSTCKVFGGKNHKIGDHGNFVSLMKKIAYKLLYEESLPWEKDALEYTREKSPLFMYDELLQLRKPLKFDKLLGHKIKTAVGDASILQPRYSPGYVKRLRSETRFYRAYTAASNYVMRKGRHFVTFKCNLGKCLHPTPDALLWFGLVRPLIPFPERQGVFTPFSSHYISRLLQLPEWDCGSNCFVYTSGTGRCQWINMKGGNDHTAFVGDWDGMQPFDGDGEIGLLLDYDDGSLTVYKNGVKLGIMAEGLSGPFCWMVTVGRWFQSEDDYRPQIKIERGAPPIAETSPSSRKRPRMNREGIEI
jgi:hypothetical protein